VTRGKRSRYRKKREKLNRTRGEGALSVLVVHDALTNRKIPEGDVSRRGKRILTRGERSLPHKKRKRSIKRLSNQATLRRKRRGGLSLPTGVGKITGTRRK